MAILHLLSGPAVSFISSLPQLPQLLVQSRALRLARFLLGAKRFKLFDLRAFGRCQFASLLLQRYKLLLRENCLRTGCICIFGIRRCLLLKLLHLALKLRLARFET
jgi:hypothetical protein